MGACVTRRRHCVRMEDRGMSRGSGEDWNAERRRDGAGELVSWVNV
jgi:hypothetical protein